jgi:hypothetical protein
LILLLFASVAAPCVAETVKYYELPSGHEITEEEARGTKHTVQTFDDGGHITSESYFGPGGKPVARKDGVHWSEYEYNDKGNMAAISYFDVDGLPMADRDGVHRTETIYDEGGTRKIGERYFGPGGGPVTGRWQCHAYTSEYVGDTRVVSYYGVDGKLLEGRDGIARYEYRYDDRRNTIYEAFFDVGGEATVDEKGVNHYERGYDGDALSWESYWGPDGKPATDKSGVHLRKYGYDDDGRMNSESYFNANGEPAVNGDGFHQYKWTLLEPDPYMFNYLGGPKKTSESFFGPAGEPVADDLDIHKYVYTYGTYNRPASESYFGKDGEAVWKKGSGQTTAGGPDGEAEGGIPPERCIHRLEWSYDDRGIVTEVRRYNIYGDLISTDEKSE